MVRGVVTVAIVTLIGCTKPTPTPSEAADSGAATTPSPSSGRDGVAPAGMKIVVLDLVSGSDSSVRVKARVAIPTGWHKETMGRDTVKYRSPGTSLFRVELTCHGVCGGAERLTRNIETHVDDDARVLKGAFFPGVEPTWSQHAEKQGGDMFFTRWDTKEGANREIHYLELDRLVPEIERVVECRGELFGADAGWLPSIEQACRALSFEVVSSDSGT